MKEETKVKIALTIGVIVFIAGAIWAKGWLDGPDTPPQDNRPKVLKKTDIGRVTKIEILSKEYESLVVKITTDKTAVMIYDKEIDSEPTLGTKCFLIRY